MKSGIFKDVESALDHFDKKFLEIFTKYHNKINELKEKLKGENQAKAIIQYLRLMNKPEVNKLLKQYKEETESGKVTSSVSALLYIVEKGDLNLIFDTSKPTKTDIVETDEVENSQNLHPHFF